MDIRVLWLQNLDLRIWYFWKRDSSFVFTEDETLWIASFPIWYDRPRPPERLLWTPSKNYFTQLPTEMTLAHRLHHEDLINSASIQHEAVWREKTAPIFPNIVYKRSFTFKGGYDIGMNNLHCYKSWLIDTILRSILLYVYVLLILIKVLWLCSSFKNIMYN